MSSVDQVRTATRTRHNTTEGTAQNIAAGSSLPEQPQTLPSSAKRPSPTAGRDDVLQTGGSPPDSDQAVDEDEWECTDANSSEDPATAFRRHRDAFATDIAAEVADVIPEAMKQMMNSAPRNASTAEPQLSIELLETAVHSACEQLARRAVDLASTLSDGDRDCHRRAQKAQRTRFEQRLERQRAASNANLRDQHAILAGEFKVELELRLAEQYAPP